MGGVARWEAQGCPLTEVYTHSVIPMARRGQVWHDGGMQVVITGIGDAFSAVHHGSSGVVLAPGGRIAIDCPGSVMGMYQQAGQACGLDLGVETIDDIVLTHLHGDHSNGLETLGFARRYLHDPPVPPRLHALPEVLDRVWEKLAPAMDGATRAVGAASRLEDYFDPRPIQPGQQVQIAGLTVEARRSIHSVPTMGLLFRSGDATFGWSGDAEFEQDHIDWLSQADCIVHECGEHFKHTLWTELDTLPPDVKARIRLIHIPDGRSVPDEPMRPVHEGELLDVGSA